MSVLGSGVVNDPQNKSLRFDMLKFGRFPDVTVPQLGAQAALLALDDAGLTIRQMEAQ